MIRRRHMGRSPSSFLKLRMLQNPNGLITAATKKYASYLSIRTVVRTTCRDRSLRIFWQSWASSWVGRHPTSEAPKYNCIGFTQGPEDFHRSPLNFLGQGLDESRELGILTDGSGVDRVFRGITVGSKKVLPSARSSEGQEVDPIVRFFTSTG